MLLPGAMAVVVPILVGIVLGVEALGGLQAGALVTGVLMAIFMANSGGAWDNAKKYIEEGNHGGKEARLTRQRLSETLLEIRLKIHQDHPSIS